MLYRSTIFLFPVCLCLGLQIGLAQGGNISGVVLDNSTNDPLPGVNVLIEGTLRGTLTNSSGRFLLENLPPGNTTIVFSSLGFSSVIQSTEVKPDTTAWMQATLEPVFLPLPNVEVVAERSIAERMTPASFTRIRGQDLEMMQPLGTEEALKSIPGVHIATDDGISNRANIGIRGLYPRRSDKILLLEDGVPIQPALYLAPSAYYNPPAERLDAIEVVKNATNVRFGAGSLVGAVNYVTRRPPVDPGGTLDMVAGSNGYFSALAAYGGSILRGRVGGELQLLFKRGDGFRDNTSFDIYNATGKLLYRPGDNTTVSFKGNAHRENSQATYSALTPFMFEEDPAQNPFEHDWLETARLAGDLNVEHGLSEYVVVLATAYANRFRRDWWRQGSSVVDANTVDPSAPDEAMIRVGLDNNRARLREFVVYGFTPRLVGQFGLGNTSHALETGVRLHRDEFDNVEIDTDRPDARVDNFEAATFGDPSDPAGAKRKKERFTANALALYVQDRVTLGEFGITAGLRVETYRQTRTDFYDRQNLQLTEEFSEVAITEILPAAGFTWVKGVGTLFGGVFKGFVPLTSSFAFATLVDDEGFEIEDNLRPERSLNFEVGYRVGRPWAVSGSLALFSNTVSDLVAAGRRADFQPIVGNLGEVRYTGLEIDARLDMEHIVATPIGLILDAQTTILESRIEQGLIDEQGNPSGVDVTGNEAPYAPEVVVRMGLTVTGGRLDLSVHYNYVGEQFADFNNTVRETPAGDNGLLPSYDYVDGLLRYRFRAVPVSAYLSVKNATNEIYRGSRLHRSSSGIFPGGFRQINLGVTVDL